MVAKPAVGDIMWGNPLNTTLDTLDTDKASTASLNELIALVNSLQATILSMGTPQNRTYNYEEAGSNLQLLAPGNDVLLVDGTVFYSTAAPAHGTYGLHRDTLVRGQFLYSNLSVIGSQGSIYVRATNTISGVPQTLFNFETSDATPIPGGSVVMKSAGQIAILNADGEAQSITTAQFVNNQWFRIDWQQTWDGLNQKITVRLFVNAESDVFDEQMAVQYPSPIPERIRFLRGGDGTAWGVDLDDYRTNNILTTWYGPINPPPSTLATYLFDSGTEGASPTVGANGVTAKSGNPTYAAAASKHTTSGTTFGINVPAAASGGVLSYALTTNSGTGSLYLKRVAKGAGPSKVVQIKHGVTILGMLRFATNGDIQICDAGGTIRATLSGHATLGIWVRLDWQYVYDSTASTLTLTARQFYTDSENTTYDTTGSFALTSISQTPDTVAIGSDSSDWNIHMDTFRVWSDVVSWPLPYGATGGPGTAAHLYSFIGDALTTGVVVSSKVTGITSVNMQVSTSSSMTSPTLVGAQTVTVDGIVKHTPTGLTQNTQYYAFLTEATGTTTFGDQIKFKTAPDGSATFTRTFALMSCQMNAASELLTISGTNQAGWTHILNWGPDELLHGGDFHYAGGGFTLNPLDPYSAHIDKYSSQLKTLLVMRLVLLSMVSLIQVSDHEYSGNGGDSYNDPISAVAITAYQKLMPVRTYADSRNPMRGRYFSRNIGPRIRLISIDFRSLDRSPSTMTDGPTKTALGATQLSWLFSELIRPEPLKIILSDVSWGPKTGVIDHQSDKWWYYQYEQTTIANFITGNTTSTGGPINVDFWGNDRHYISWLPGTNPGGGAPYNTLGGFDVLCGSGISQHSLVLGSGEQVAQVYGDSASSPYGFGTNGVVCLYMQITLTDNGTNLITRDAKGYGAYLNQIAGSGGISIAPAQSDIIQRVSNIKTWSY